MISIHSGDVGTIKVKCIALHGVSSFQIRNIRKSIRQVIEIACQTDQYFLMAPDLDHESSYLKHDMEGSCVCYALTSQSCFCLLSAPTDRCAELGRATWIAVSTPQRVAYSDLSRTPCTTLRHVQTLIMSELLG